MASVLEKNIHDVVSTLTKNIAQSDVVFKRGLLQSLDPRTKLIGTFILIVLASWSPTLLFLIFLYLVSLFLGSCSGVSLKTLLQTLIVLPFFALFLAIPLLFSFVSPGQVLFTFPGPFALSITYQGVYLALRFIIRVATAVTVVQLILLTTKWDQILKALRFFRIPAGLVFALALTYRYIYILLTAALDMLLARKSRTVGRLSGAAARSWTGALIGNMMTKSFVLSSEVHDAMVSRGFTGRVQTIEAFTFGRSDYVGLLILACMTLGAILVK